MTTLDLGVHKIMTNPVLSTGQILQQRYHIVSHLGKGGMGTVYQAQDMRLNNRPVAVKELDPAQLPPASQQTALQAFQREAAILAGLSHPGLTTVYDYFLENNKFYLVMELVEGETMQQAWERMGRRFAETQVVLWAQELSEVLHYLHSQHPPVIFRDLKPDNIMVQPNGRLKLIDFGIARHFTPGKSNDTTTFGTPGYAAPEQYGRGQTDARSDLYALGIVTHQLLTGHDPTTTPFQLPPIEQTAPQISPSVKQIVMQALEIDPARRPSSAAAFSTALQASTLPPDTIARNKSVQTIWNLGLVAALLLLLTSGVWLLRNRQPTTPLTVQETTVATQSVSESVSNSDGTTTSQEVIRAVTTPTPLPTISTDTITPTVTPHPARPSATPTTAPPTQTPLPTATIVAVTAFRPTQSQINMTSIWQGLTYEDIQSPGTKRYNTTVSTNETRRWSFIWCGRTHADLANILAPLTFSMRLNGQPIDSSLLLEHDQVLDGWQCRYWSTLLRNWVSGQTIEVEAYYHLSERIYDGANYYEPGAYRQIITVRVR
jgi:serine/threonine protein kinase